ncbi:MAG: hypothetical protein ACM3ZB_05070 [bacterium]|jgi:hypothetical protein
MWILARYGVFSVFSARTLTGDPDPELVIIRAYNHEHLSALRERIAMVAGSGAINMLNSCELVARRSAIGEVLAELAAEPEWPDGTGQISADRARAGQIAALRSAWERMVPAPIAERNGRVKRNADGAITNADELTALDLFHEKVLCPVCGEKVFAMWPEGWDGHAGWKCPMIEGATPEERKANVQSPVPLSFRPAAPDSQTCSASSHLILSVLLRTKPSTRGVPSAWIGHYGVGRIGGSEIVFPCRPGIAPSLVPRK